MDGLQAAVSSLAVIAIVLLMVLVVCHYMGPRATAWVRSNREEKIGLSKNKLFNANGYLIPHSNSDIILGSTGSFKRFDSIDRDYKQMGQSSVASPTWNIPGTDIPPQPLRPAPAPSSSGTISPNNCIKFKERDFGGGGGVKPIKQQSLERMSTTSIPRPVARRQLSTPISCSQNPINLSASISKLANGPRSASTNPFLNGSLHGSLTEEDTTLVIENEKKGNNPFMENSGIFNFEPSNVKSILENENLNLREAEESITRLERASFSPDIVTSKNIFNSLTDIGNKYIDSPCTDVIENLANQIKKHVRNRSLSETEAGDESGPLKSSTNPFINSSLHKTVSETYLEQYNLSRQKQTWSFGKSLGRQGSLKSFGSQSSVDSEILICSESTTSLHRAVSCESVSSESSVLLADLELPVPPVTGHLCVGLQYDKNSVTPDGQDLVVTVLEAKELTGPVDVDTMDTFVRIYLVPDENGALQTKLFKNSPCPSYNETFCFWLTKKSIRRSLWFHLYHTSAKAHTLIGEAELKLVDVPRPVTQWLSLTDSRHNNCIWGELMFSLSYLPTAERLTIVVVKARNLKIEKEKNIFVKIYLLKNDKKLSKKKTTLKRGEGSPIYNESMIFSVPPYMLNSIQVRLTVVSSSDSLYDRDAVISPIGHVIVGNGTNGKCLRHWHQMLSSLRKPVAMWHGLRTTGSKAQNDVNVT